MSSKGFVPDPLTPAQLQEIVTHALEHGSDDRSPETFHARFDHLERGLSIDDVIHALSKPLQFAKAPRFNRDEWQWIYCLAAQSIDGDPITVVIAVDTAAKSFEVVTRWRDES